MTETKFDWHKWLNTILSVAVAAALAYLTAKTGVTVPTPVLPQAAPCCCK